VKRYRFLSLWMVVLVGISFTDRAWASSGATDPDRPAEDAAYICSPRLQLRFPDRCDSYGPASELADYARQGIYPAQPLPAEQIGIELTYVPYNYLKIPRTNIGVYPSVAKAIEGGRPSRTLGKGFIYVSWIRRYDEAGTVVYQIGPGEYIRGDNVSRITPSSFRGLVFQRMPRNDFGWVLTTVTPSIAPGYDQPLTSKTYYRYQVIQIYDTVQAGGFEWYMIAPGEWIEQRQIARVHPDPERPEGVEGERWISVNLFEQTLAAYENGRLVFATLISSGLRGWWTRPGVFQVYKKLDSTPMQGAFEADRSDFYYLEDVPWTLYYDEDRALHGAYWHNNFGFAQSHGCVNLPPADAQWIYNWADVGTWVYVWDPSGATPTDEGSYSPGGV
jgi:hypothetical protein